jgi:hypothetical protein
MDYYFFAVWIWWHLFWRFNRQRHAVLAGPEIPLQSSANYVVVSIGVCGCQVACLEACSLKYGLDSVWIRFPSDCYEVLGAGLFSVIISQSGVYQ